MVGFFFAGLAVGIEVGQSPEANRPSAKELVHNELTRQAGVCDKAPESKECKHLQMVERYKLYQEQQ